MKNIFPTRLRTTETWVSVVLCYAGAAMPLFGENARDHSLTLTGIMIGVLTVGLVCGVNVLVRSGSALAKGIVILGVLFCAGKLLMVAIAGAQS